MKNKTITDKIIETLKENPLYTRADIAQAIGTTEQRVSEYISNLKRAGYISEQKILIPQNREAKIEIK